MTTGPSRKIRVGAYDVTLSDLHASASSLFVRFHVTGPDPGSWDLSDHVVIGRPGDARKLRLVETTSGVDRPGSGFDVWHLAWPGGTQVRITYFHDGDPVEEEHVSVPPPTDRAALDVLSGLDAVLVDVECQVAPAD